MFITSLLLSTLAVAGVAHAQSTSYCSKDITIQSSSDLEKIANCSTFDGTITIGQELTSVDLGSIQQITGSFICEQAQQLTTITMGSVRSIGNEFRLTELTVLATLSCPQLTSVGSINWVTLPQLKQFGATRQVTQAGSVIISDARLESLSGIDLTTASIFRVDNCKYLQTVNVGLKNVSQELTLEFNGKSTDIEFPDLIWAYNMTIRDASSVQLPKLVHINGSMDFEENLFQSISCPSLEGVDQSLSFIGNTELTNVTFPKLTQVGGALKFANDTNLEIVDGFPSLQSIGGAIDCAGNFTNVTFPSLKDVSGGFHLETSNVLDCSPFQAMKGSVIQGDEFTCLTKVANPESKGSSSNSGSGNKSSAGRTTVGSILGLSFAAVFLAAF